MANSLKPPVTYQGGKSRLASAIVDILWAGPDACYADLCCGSGAIGLTLVSRGLPPNGLLMVDRGPWGAFWHRVGTGTFDQSELRSLVSDIPSSPRMIKSWVGERVSEPVPDDPTPMFLLIQATAVGGAWVCVADGKWKLSSGLRDYWMPTPTSSRRSPVNPMMPMPATILDRVAAVCEKMQGVDGRCCGIDACMDNIADVTYIDPPYRLTTGEPLDCDVVGYALGIGGAWVSETIPLSENAVLLSGGRSKGGMTGSRKNAHSEYLSWVGVGTGPQ